MSWLARTPARNSPRPRNSAFPYSTRRLCSHSSARTETGFRMKKITKAVFPVAGMGTRFLPATKASPKEMLPVVDKPLIQYAVEEAVAAGITELIFITGRTKRAIEDHFDKAYELETELEARGKKELLELVRNTVPSNVNCIYIRQAEALGLGHAVLCASHVIDDDEAFAVMLADDLLDNPGGKPVMQQMVEVYNYHRCSVLGTMSVPREHTRQYGIVSTAGRSEEHTSELQSRENLVCRLLL